MLSRRTKNRLLRAWMPAPKNLRVFNTSVLWRDNHVTPTLSTQPHRHHVTEELHHITHGQGRMTLGEESFDVAVGDTVIILPGTRHTITNTGPEDLRFLCCCAPAYSHDDTELMD